MKLDRKTLELFFWAQVAAEEVSDCLNTESFQLTVTDDEFIKKIQEMKQRADELLAAVEEKDPNLDLETTTLPSVDGLFEGEPITDYVGARLEMIYGNDSPENLNRMVTAALKLKEEQEAPTGEDLLMRVRSVDELFTYEINDLLIAIENDLGAKQDYSLSDLDLIRFYLEHLPSNSKFDIEEMSDAEVAREWSRIMSNKKN
ncbi:transcriptional regulator [Bacillus phage phiNIT1]|uniref:Putative LuxR family two component transcriptional regulator n=1 Tax=Bacillus phage phiNIT1 TaxID=207656 RepID=S6B1D0_9CAUD|nr:transcriptional regulator [Bacillus phage phiNIT1]BAN59534.1 putative LuxR family two component transcriptional regulator [Bacillus phage phiNIT1]